MTTHEVAHGITVEAVTDKDPEVLLEVLWVSIKDLGISTDSRESRYLAYHRDRLGAAISAYGPY